MNTQTNTPAFKMNNGMLAYVSAQRNKVAKAAPKRKLCPACKSERAIQFFGVRTHRNPLTGKPERFSLQSYCVDCRAKGSKPVARKTSAPKVVAPVQSERPLDAVMADMVASVRLARAVSLV